MRGKLAGGFRVTSASSRSGGASVGGVGSPPLVGWAIGGGAAFAGPELQKPLWPALACTLPTNPPPIHPPTQPARCISELLLLRLIRGTSGTAPACNVVVSWRRACGGLQGCREAHLMPQGGVSGRRPSVNAAAGGAG